MMKVVVCREIASDGEKHPRKFLRSLFSEESVNKRAYLIIDDLHKKIFLIMGRGLSRIHFAIAQRSARFARAHGYEVTQFVAGRNFDVIEINEGEEPPPEFDELLEQELEVREDYSVILGAPEVVRGPVKVITDPEKEKKAIPASWLLECVEDVHIERLLEAVEADPDVEGEPEEGQVDGVDPQEPVMNNVVLRNLLEHPPAKKSSSYSDSEDSTTF